MKYCFLSPLPIGECAERLTQYLDDHPLHFFSRRPLTLVGEIDGYWFTLRTSSHSNPNLFHGTLCSCQGGTLIEGDYRMHWAAKVLDWRILGCGVAAICVLSYAVVLSVVGLLFVSGAYTHLGGDLFPLLGSLFAVGLFLPLGGMVLALVMYLAAVVSQKTWESIDIPRITAFLEERLQAQRVELAE
jgi:hypothetical protein